MGKFMVIKQQLEIDVFVNNGGAISISQTDPYDGHDGPFVIVIQPENINLLIKALKNAKKSMQEDAGSFE
jgi:hypothetical protein